MAIIVTQKADTAYHIRDAFRSYGRDDYPFPVYEAIFDLIEETHAAGEYYELDVIAWCGDLAETDLKSENLEMERQGLAESELYTLGDLADEIRLQTVVLYIDEADEVIYHLAY